MSIGFQLYATGKDIPFLADGDDELLIPLKKGTPEAVLVKSSSVYYVCAAFEATDAGLCELNLKHTWFEDATANFQIKTIRTTSDEKVKVAAYPEHVSIIDGKDFHTYDVHKFYPGHIGFDFFLDWIFDYGLGHDYQYSDGAILAKARKVITQHLAHNRYIPDYQSAALHNLAFKLYYEVNAPVPQLP